MCRCGGGRRSPSSSRGGIRERRRGESDPRDLLFRRGKPNIGGRLRTNRGKPRFPCGTSLRSKAVTNRKETKVSLRNLLSFGSRGSLRRLRQRLHGQQQAVEFVFPNAEVVEVAERVREVIDVR